MYDPTYSPETPAIEPRLMHDTSSPDNPPYNLGSAVLLWVVIMLTLLIIPTIGGLAYLFAVYGTSVEQLSQAAVTALEDPKFLLATLLLTSPTHLIQIGLAWCLVTGFGKRPFWNTPARFVLSASGLSVTKSPERNLGSSNAVTAA